MRPVLLEFAGLHSYREKQTIDFDELGAYGLFGVFGPTGSGKSTILDAITLALFGKVDRADRGTRAIINQHEKRASVAFTFDLAGTRYRVERTYESDRANPAATRARQARLVKVQPWGESGAGSAANAGTELEVLADKPSDVDGEVIKLLGMSMEDFTRAVVLPQGQFDRFLKLTDGDRAKMLERIFCLEQYGDALAQKARSRVNVLAAELGAIAAEKQGLGDASEEAVAQAKRRLGEYEEAVVAKQKEKGEADALLAAQQELKRLDELKRKLLARQAELEAEAVAISKKEAQLEAANKAEPLRGWITKEKNLAERMAASRLGVDAARESLQAAQETLGQASASRDAARERHDKETPELQRRLLECEKAVEDDKQLKEAVHRRDKANAALGQIQTRLEKTRADIGATEAELQKVKSELARLGERRNRFAVSPEERQAVATASEALAALENAEMLARDAEETLRDKVGALLGKKHELRAVLRRELDEESVTATGLDALLDGSVGGRDQSDVVDLIGVATSASFGQALMAVDEGVRSAVGCVVDEAKAAVQAAERDHRELQRKHLASVLAIGLADGEPCPVCGSPSHPRPASPSDDVREQLAQAEAREQTARKRLDAVTAWDKNAEKSLAAFRAAAEEVAGTFAREAAKKRAVLAQAAEKLDRVRGDLLPQEIRPRQKAIEEADRDLAKIDKLREKSEHERETYEARLRDLAKQAEGDALQAQTLASDIRSLDERIAELSAKVKEVAGEYDLAELQAELRKSLQSLKETLARAESAFENARAAAAKAEQHLAASMSAAAEVERELSEARRELAEALGRAGFANASDAGAAMLDENARKSLMDAITKHKEEVALVAGQLKDVEQQLAGRAFDEQAFRDVDDRVKTLTAELEDLQAKAAVAAAEVKRLRANQKRWQELEERRKKAEHIKDLASRLVRLLEGRKFVQFLAEEHLRDMVVEASRRLGALTGQRYALELDEGCGFLMRDDYMGGQRRPVGSLSGGETFLTSLALALALSGKIQLRGRYPLGFFFLDEGFGTLDREKLELVMATLEKLHDSERMVGVISHVPELREQLPVYIEVSPADAAGHGSRVTLKKT